MIRLTKHVFLFIIALSLFTTSYARIPYNINVIGHVHTTGSFSRHTTSFFDCLYNDANIQLFKTTKSSPLGFPEYFKDVVDQAVDLYDNKPTGRYIKKNNPLTGITIYADPVYWNGWEKYKKLTNKSTIRYAYCVTERTLVTDQDSIINRWVTKLNSNFDGLLVPDEWLIETFKNVGVKIPIFTLPLALGLHTLFKQPTKQAPQIPFVFGFSGGCWPHKNQKLLIQAFAEEFGNDPGVELVIHSRFSPGFKKLIETCKQAKASNIRLEQKSLTRQEYENFIASLDCYVTISKGEGFSIIPREVLARGIPCIVSNNTAQKTICNSGCVYAVPANIIEPSSWVFAQKSVGVDYNCSLDDVKKALRTVYANHHHYRTLALLGREWVQQYLPENLAGKYKTLVAPRMVILDDHNEITEHALTTNSKELFGLYKKICSPTNTTFIAS